MTYIQSSGSSISIFDLSESYNTKWISGDDQLPFRSFCDFTYYQRTTNDNCIMNY